MLLRQIQRTMAGTSMTGT